MLSGALGFGARSLARRTSMHISVEGHCKDFPFAYR